MANQAPVSPTTGEPVSVVAARNRLGIYLLIVIDAMGTIALIMAKGLAPDQTRRMLASKKPVNCGALAQAAGGSGLRPSDRTPEQHAPTKHFEAHGPAATFQQCPEHHEAADEPRRVEPRQPQWQGWRRP